MKKLTLLAAVLGFAVCAQAEAPLGLPFKALGYDDNLGHVTGRLALPGGNLDLGLGFKYDGTEEAPVDNDDNNLQYGLSAFYLLPGGNWGPVANHLALGGVITKLPVADDNIKITVFAGFQPEITLLDRIILSTRFGASLDIAPVIILQTAGQGISIVNGVNFKILF